MTQVLSSFRRSVLRGIAVFGLAASVTAPALAADGEVNIYSMRQAYLMEPILEAFTKETGIKVNVLFAKDGLLERLAQEGRNSPADIVLTSSFGNTMRVVNDDLAQPVSSETLNSRIPAEFRGEDGQWYALTMRARFLYTSKERVPEGAITTYKELADPKWKGKICTRSGTHAYNVQLIASQIAHYGEEATKTWLEGLRDNLARKPQGNDRAQVKAVSEGECDISIGNSYYYFLMNHNEEQKPWADAVNPVFAVTEGHGTHVNVSGMAMTKHAPNPESAILLMEFLAGETAQHLYAEVNFEYPVNPAVEPSAEVAAIGKLVPDDLPLDEISKNLGAALSLVAQVGYNE